MIHIKTHKVHNTALLFILIAPFTITWYCVYVFNPANAGNIYLYAVQILADIIAIISVGTLWLTILLHILNPDNEQIDHVAQKKWLEEGNPTVEVYIPVANEPIAIIKKTVTHAVAMAYPHITYVLDDGHSDEVKTVVTELGARYLSRNREGKKHAKAGNLNFGLTHAKADFFAVFDSDHIPDKNFLVELLPFFEDEKVALVQTPQYYTNTHNFIAAGTSQAQDIFYKYVQPAKNSYNAAFCVGTNMIYRKSAIDAVGGISQRDHSEDVWTTILLHEKGYTSIFYNKVLARGRAPESIRAFFRQQNRWAQGGFSMFFNHNPLSSKELSIDQKLQYFFSNFHYFSGIAILIYMLLPITYLLFGIHPMDVLHNKGWLIHYVPYFLTIYLLPIFLLGSLKLSTISISMASFYPYLKALISVALKNEYTWIATEAKTSARISFILSDIWPHLFIICISVLSIFVGWYRPVDITTTAITSFWVLINTYTLFIFIKNGIND